MNDKRLRWWDISGQSESGTTFILVVEATSRRRGIRRFCLVELGLPFLCFHIADG